MTTTPGRAAYDRWHSPDCTCGSAWGQVGDDVRDLWEAVAQAAIDAAPIVRVATGSTNTPAGQLRPLQDTPVTIAQPS